MMYSVWRPEWASYDYYESRPVLGDVMTPTPEHIKAKSKLGATPEQAAWRLPSDARKVGRGPLAKGMVASDASSLALGDVPTSTSASIGLLVLAVYGLYRIF